MIVRMILDGSRMQYSADFLKQGTQKLSENNIWCHVDTRLTNVQRDVLKNELVVDHLKEEVAEHIMDNGRDCEEIIEVLADCDSKIDRLRNNFDKLSVAKIE